jgi:hypothetical protein
VKTRRVRRFFTDNGLSLVLLALFLLFWGGQCFVGRLDYNEERAERHLPPLSMSEYLASPHFIEATMENWESEFLQMGAFVFLTVFLVQRGSAESRDPEELGLPPRRHRDPDAPWPVRRGGWVLLLYENSLGLAFVLLFVASFAVHAYGGARLYSEEEVAAGRHAVDFWEYIKTSHFWFESFQNWQSEFLAILSMVFLTIFLRQRGSPESKEVHAPHSETGK